MPHTIITPTEIEQPLYEGQLEFTPGSIEQMARGKDWESIPDELRSAEPSVTVGRAVCWNLAHLAREKGKSLPAELSLLLREVDFYLLRLAFSLRPERNSQVAWARFGVYLRAKVGEEQPIAFDLYPREVYDEAKTNLKVSIAPSLKFAEVELSLGEVVTDIEFGKLEPVIVGYGVQESTPNWDFEQHQHHPLRGSKFCYLIVQKPHPAEAVRLTLDITADVVTKYGLLSAKVTKKDRAHLSQVVCTD